MDDSDKLADVIMVAVRKECELPGRSITGALEGSLSPDELNPVEQEVWFDQFATMMAVPSKQEKALHLKRRRLGRGVGICSGELIYEK